MNRLTIINVQTEKQLKEYGEKLSEPNKTAITEALEKLRAAHSSQDIGGIDTAMNTLNTAWQAASAEMYQASGDGTSGPGPDAGGPAQDAGGPSADAGDVSDVEYEEVNDKK